MKFLERFWFGCGHCRGVHECPLVGEGVDSESIGTHADGHGPALVGTVILVFILPLATAIAGAYLAGMLCVSPAESSLGLWQLVGAAVGFFVGVGLAKLTFWTRRRFWSVDGGIE